MTISMDAADPSADAEVERARFEAWHYSEYSNSNFMRTADGRYLHSATAHRWAGWLAKARDAEKENGL